MSHVEEILKKVDSSKACIGNPDKKFAVLAASRNGVFTNAQVTYTSVVNFKCSLVLGASHVPILF